MGYMDERRQASPRIKTNIKTICQYSGTTVNADILNLSSGGIFVRTDFPPPVDTELALRFHLPGDPEPLDVEGRAVWIKQTANALPPGIGVQFNEIPPLHKRRIQAFVESCMVN